MKRVLSLFLCAALLLCLIACQKDEEEKNTSEEEIFAGLSAEELYRTASSGMNKLSSSFYQTSVLISGEEKDKIDTVRVRDGFDDFQYSRTSLSQCVYFSKQTAASVGPLGAFRAPATSRSFQAFLTAYVFPAAGLDPDGLSDFSREGNRVSYTSDNEAILSLYSRMVIPGADYTFCASSLSGTATVSPAGYFSAEEIHLTGTAIAADGEKEIKISLVTTLLKVKSEEIEVFPIPEGEYVQVDDLARIYSLADALSLVQGETNLTATAISSEAIEIGGKRLSLDQTRSVSQVENGAYSSAWCLRQGLHDAREEWLEETLLDGQVRRRAVFDAVTAATLSDDTTTDTSVSLWQAMAAALLPAFSEFDSIPALSGDADLETVSFTLSPSAVDRLKNSLATYFPDSGADSAVLSSAAGSGNITLKDGRVVAVSYTYDGAFEGGSLAGSVTLTLERNLAGASVTLPQIQPPVVGEFGQDAGGDVH